MDRHAVNQHQWTEKIHTEDRNTASMCLLQLQQIAKQYFAFALDCVHPQIKETFRQMTELAMRQHDTLQQFMLNKGWKIGQDAAKTEEIRQLINRAQHRRNELYATFQHYPAAHTGSGAIRPSYAANPPTYPPTNFSGDAAPSVPTSGERITTMFAAQRSQMYEGPGIGGYQTAGQGVHSPSTGADYSANHTGGDQTGSNSKKPLQH